MSHQKRGKFVVIEGPDFCGKTTQTDAICEVLTEAGIEHVRVREPGGTHMGEIVRNILKTDSELVDNAELLLFAAARAQIVANVIEPALAAGKWVIADRFLPSTIAMQFYARRLFESLPLETLQGLTQLMVQPQGATEAVLPDLTIFLMPTDEMLDQRARLRDGGLDRLESDPEFVKRVRDGYRLLCSGDTAYTNTDDKNTAYMGIKYTNRKICISQVFESNPQSVTQVIKNCLAYMLDHHKHTFKSERDAE